MILFVTEYLDYYYPRYRHTNHPPVSRASKAVYAYKLLLCAAELRLSPEVVKDCLVEALKKEKAYDPRIALVTRPKVLGVWLRDTDKVDISVIHQSRYSWTGDTTIHELDPFAPEHRETYERLIPHWKKQIKD